MDTQIDGKYANEMLFRALCAAKLFKTYDQAAVDRIVESVFKAAYDARIDLAKLAHEETGIGILDHKIIKNIWASLLVYENIKDQKTVGVISRDPLNGISEIAQPHGPILHLIPLTNPTSTTIFKTLISMKTRNPIILSPHGAARKCIVKTAEILYKAALNAGAPEDCIQWITKKHIDYLKQIMRHPALALIIATGTRRIVEEAYSSGKPVIGVGPGNVPVFVDRTADFELAARYIVMSKTFDNGTICASEQALVVEKYVAAQLEPFFKAEGAYYCSEWQAQKLGEIVYDRENRVMRAEVVGRSAEHLANLAGINVEKNTRMLIAPCSGIGPQFPLSHEILTPLLTYYVVDTYDQAIDYCVKLNQLGGQGHTVSIYTNREKVINDFIAKVSAGRICVNTPTTHGAIGGTFNTLNPSFTLSCGTEAGNIYTDNITTTHLLNIHRIARRRPNIRWFSIPEKTWLDPETTAEKIIMQYNKNY